MTYEVFASYIDKFGDRQINNWTFCTDDNPDAEITAIKFLKHIKEKRKEPNSYQRANNLPGSLMYYSAGLDSYES